MLTVAVLGPLDLRRDGAPVPVPAGKATELLIRLALDAGERVPTDRLLEDLWSGQGGAVARNTLQSKVSLLRRALGDPGLVRGAGAGYTLLVDRACVDALDVLRLADSASAWRSDDPEATRDASAAALAMFRGDLFPDAGDGPWLAPHRTRLEEARLRLLEDNLAARLDLGSGAPLIGELQALVADHPLRESLWVLLVTALYRAGRQAEALAAYRRARGHFADELGLDLGPQLRALEGRVLTHDPQLGESHRLVDSTIRTGGNLPAWEGTLVGRAAQLAAVDRLVTQQRLVTLVGPAGVGKTRLAVEVGRGTRFRDGAWLVRLDAARDVGSIWRQVGEALRLTEATQPLVLDRLRGGQLLLILDTCEHLVDGLQEPVHRMLSASPGLHILATSQVELRAEEEHVQPVQPLTAADSVALFMERAAHQRPSFAEAVAARDELTTVEAVCRSLDGLPLAIELAAARTKILPVAEIAQRIGDRFALLADPTLRGERRRRTLEAAISWSYDLLFPDDQRGLWALACFSGGASLAAVESVLTALAVPAVLAVDVVGRLVDRNLATVDDDLRFRLLDSVRDFSRARLQAAGQERVARQAHAAWFAAVAAEAEAGSRGPRQPEYAGFTQRERANVEDALAWATNYEPGTALRIAVGFGWTLALLGGGPQAAERVRHAVDAAGDAPDRDRSSGLLLAGWLEASGGDVDRAVADLQAAAQLGDASQRDVSRLYLAFVCSQQGRAQDALDLLAECLDAFARTGRRWEEGASWLLSAWAQIALGRLEHGRSACEAALRLLGPLGDRWALGHAEGLLGGLAQAEHRFAVAIEHLNRAVDATRELGFAAAEAHHLANLGRAYEQAGDRAAAAVTLERSLATAQAAGDRRTAALACARLGRVMRVAGNSDEARDRAAEARRWYAAAGGGEGLLLAEYLLAVLDADHGDPTAGQRLGSVLASAQEGADVEVELLTCDALARHAARTGRKAAAGEWLEVADRLVPRARHLVTDSDRVDAESTRALLMPSCPEDFGNTGDAGRTRGSV